jgi:8-oxo-dGTP pyrophosphatase MutT (NUDIX family)
MPLHDPVLSGRRPGAHEPASREGGASFAETIARLDAALRRPLPGAGAQDRLAPLPRREWPAGFNPARIRAAAGLLLLVPIEDRPHVILTVRADSVRHGGQVSLPGGVMEPGESFEQAALREAGEEVGLAPDGVRTLGALTPVDIPVSGFRLHPILAAAAIRPVLRPHDAEVARILEVALADLLDPRAVVRRRMTREGRTLRVPTLLVQAGGPVEIWGATAMVLAELLSLLGWPAAAAPPDPASDPA